jgi:hypothetical protein
MALAVPVVRGLVCSLQEVLRHKENDDTRVRLGRHVHPFWKIFIG